MFILDDIEGFGDSVKCTGIPGGAGTYVALGAAICSGNKEQVYWIVDEGYDFPQDVKRQLQGWPVSTHFRVNKEKETTRGLNYYPNKNDQGKDQDLRLFKFLTPKIQIVAQDWVDTFGYEAVKSRIQCFHIVCSASRCQTIIEDLLKIKDEKFTVVWEPLPTMCDYVHLSDFKQIFSREDVHIVFSPNAEETSRLLHPNAPEPITLEDCTVLLEDLQDLLGTSHKALIRCGKYGSIYKENGNIINLPAYHYKSQNNVRDPTGGGNTYLGGFSLAFAKTKDFKIASVCGNIAAGCAIEQVGLPNYDVKSHKWNGLSFRERLQSYIDTYELNITAEEVLSKLLK